MNRSFTARLSHRTPRRLRDYLWATHRIFNESLAYMLKHYFWMQNLTDREPEQDKKNRLRERFHPPQLAWFRLIYRDMMGLDLPKDKRSGRSQSAQAWMEPITFSRRSEGDGPGESSKNIQETVKKAIRELREHNQWLFDRELAFPFNPDNGFRRGLFGSAARRILNFEQNSDTHRGYYEEAKRKFERWIGGADAQESVEEEDTRRVGWKRTVLLRNWGKHEGARREAELEEIGLLTWAHFERAKAEFTRYERERTKKRAAEHGLTFAPNRMERINGAMTRGWRDIYERLMPPDMTDPPGAEAAASIIKAYQTAEPRKIGDINFFLWLADKPHLWRYVETMRRFNDFQRKIEQYNRPIQFRYPRYNRRPEWFTFSETSPGHMYTIVSMNPMVIEFSIFAPIEDVPILELFSGGWLKSKDVQRVAERVSLSDDERDALKHAKAIQKKLDKGSSLSDSDSARWKLANETRDKLTSRLLNDPVDWSAYRLTPERLAERRADYVATLNKKDPNLVAKANLQAVHDWTDSVWMQLLDGFFKDDPPLDLSRFQRVMVRYELRTDKRLRPFVESPVNKSESRGRLVIVSEERQQKRQRLIMRADPPRVEIQQHPGGRRPRFEKWPEEQGLYSYWFGPSFEENGVAQHQFLRPIPLVFGGVRLEYRESKRADVDPVFTLSCELDEGVYEPADQRILPKPEHRIKSSRLGKPLKRNGWGEGPDGTIVCRFKERAKLQAIGNDAGLEDEHPLPGIKLIRGRPKSTNKNKEPRPVVVEAIFDRSAGWEWKPEGAENDANRYVEDWVAQGGDRRIDAGLRAIFIDLGHRHTATGAIVEFVDDGNGKGVLPNPLKPLAVEFLNVPGVTLTHIQRHQDERRRKQRKACPRGSRKAFEIRGAHLPRGQLFARKLLDHVENLKDDRRKKSAHAVVRAALKHGVDYIVFENLKGYRPDVEFGRRTNAALMTWNRRELVEFVKMEAAPFGIHVYEWVPPHHTSRFCHRCGGVGFRFTHITAALAAKDALAPAELAVDADGTPILDTKGKQVFRRRWSPHARRMRGTPLGLMAGMRQAIDGGKHFCCAECGLMVNADYNAAMNLARKLANDFPAYQRYSYSADRKSWVVDGQTLVGRAFWDRAKALVQQRLNQRFKQPSETPPAGGWPDGFAPPDIDLPF